MDLQKIYKKTLQLIESVLYEKAETPDDIYELWRSKLISSITYVQILVCLEAEFNIEFEDELLIVGSFSSIKELSKYIYNKVS